MFILTREGYVNLSQATKIDVADTAVEISLPEDRDAAIIIDKINDRNFDELKKKIICYIKKNEV